MSTWDDNLKKQAIEEYLAAEPTPENSMEIASEIAERLNQSPNGVRMILIKAGVYVAKKKAETTTSSGGATKSGTTRVSKEAAISQLNEAIEAAGGVADSEIISKLTGKAAVYFANLISNINK